MLVLLPRRCGGFIAVPPGHSSPPSCVQALACNSASPLVLSPALASRAPFSYYKSTVFKSSGGSLGWSAQVPGHQLSVSSLCKVYLFVAFSVFAFGQKKCMWRGDLDWTGATRSFITVHFSAFLHSSSKWLLGRHRNRGFFCILGYHSACWSVTGHKAVPWFTTDRSGCCGQPPSRINMHINGWLCVLWHSFISWTVLYLLYQFMKTLS